MGVQLMMECFPSMHQDLASMSDMEGRKGERKAGREGRRDKGMNRGRKEEKKSCK